MNNFEWVEEPTPEELDALGRYKDDVWMEINQELRSGSLSPTHQPLVQLLDSVIQKGRCTCPLTLYRALSARRVPKGIGEILRDPAFLSATVTEAATTEFYPEVQPAKLVIALLGGTPMAVFEHDAAGGEERERLLPRRTSLVVTAVEEITDLQRILREQCTSGRPWLNEHSTLLKVQLRLRENAESRE